MIEGNLKAHSQRAKQYSTLKYGCSIAEVFFLFLLLVLVLNFGFTKNLAAAIEKLIPLKLLVLPVYFLALSLVYYLASFPLTFYHGFFIEHQFLLSKQALSDWLKDQLKSGIISYIIVLVLLEAFYFLLQRFTHSWWLILAAFWIFFSVVLAQLAPVIIIPLFFKYKKLQDVLLCQRILELAQKMRVKILDVFEIDFSKKTLKANAAFLGVGTTRRVLLADTLKDKYTYDEIEVILAHEFAHYRLRHLLKLIGVNSLVTLTLLYCIYVSSKGVLEFFGFTSLGDIAALAVVFLYFLLFGIITQPLGNYMSRVYERQADKMALEATGNKEAFISMMEKLEHQNLADRSPHPIIKFFFFDHPPIDERIAMAGGNPQFSPPPGGRDELG